MVDGSWFIEVSAKEELSHERIIRGPHSYDFAKGRAEEMAREGFWYQKSRYTERFIRPNDIKEIKLTRRTEV